MCWELVSDVNFPLTPLVNSSPIVHNWLCLCVGDYLSLCVCEYLSLCVCEYPSLCVCVNICLCVQILSWSSSNVHSCLRPWLHFGEKMILYVFMCLCLSVFVTVSMVSCVSICTPLINSPPNVHSRLHPLCVVCKWCMVWKNKTQDSCQQPSSCAHGCCSLDSTSSTCFGFSFRQLWPAGSLFITPHVLT